MRRWASFALIGLSAMLACGLAVAGAGAQQGPLTLEERTASSLGVAWNWDERPAAAFEVAWRARGEAAAASWRSVRKGPSERRHTISELDAGTHYIVRMRALDAAGLPLSDLRRVFATAESAPLTLELHSSRELCTAGTLTEVSWTISGGVAPYELSIESAAVDVDADNVRVNCGALTEAEAGDAEAALAAKTVSAVVTDSRGVQRQAALEVVRARALPALPPATEYGDLVWAHRGEMGFKWLAPATQYSCRKPSCFAIRWRAVGAEAWAHASLTLNLSEQNLAIGIVRGLANGVVYEAAAAAMRDPIELETPEALRWTAPLSGTTLTNPTGLTATATHDTVTVRWDRQPTARSWSVYLSGPDGGSSERVTSWKAEGWGDPESGVHEVVFRHLPSSTRYKAVVAWDPMEGYPETRAEMTVETLALPAGREPLKRGAQNLRATATHDIITAMWDQPFEESADFYLAFLFRVDYPYRAARVTPVWHPNTQVTFADLEPDTDYRVKVVHMAIVRSSVEISITTSAQPSSSNEDGAAGASAGQQSDADEWPLSGAFQPVWPHPLRMANGEWSVLTDDVEGSRFDRWHGGIGTSLTPLHLELHSSRELCTAGTLTEVSWTISGGVAPYELSIEGEAVDVDADNIRINCGALTETESEAGNAAAALAAKTVTATVTDSRGVQRQAALDVARARALPAPTPRAPTTVRPTSLHTDWVTIGGAHHDAPIGWWLIRWRSVDAESGWSYNEIEQTRPGDVVFGRFGGLSEGSSYTFAVAALRDPIEQLTPNALTWSSELEARTTTTPTGVGATATHDTATVTWNDQPEADLYVKIIRADGAGREEWIHVRPGADPADEATFINLEPETEYDITVAVDDAREGRLSTATKVTTAVAPASWQAPARGAQNLSVTATRDTITATWDAPVPNTRDRWVVYVEHPSWHSAYNRWVSAPLTFTLEGLSPATTYTVSVVHLDLYGVEVSTTVTTADAPKHGHYDQPPLIEWWADGRPTSPPLHLELRSSRKLCTAGTLTEVSWTISGGVVPYQLSIEGAAVNVDADNIRINCGALSEAEAGDAEAALAAKTVSAVVTDSRGVQRQAALDVARARALPAPSPRTPVGHATTIGTSWVTVDGKHHGSDVRWWLIRWRAASAPGDTDWTYRLEEHAPRHDVVLAGFGGLNQGTAYVFAAAALRDPIEQLTPDAITWSDVLKATTATTPTGVCATSTHDTITVTWDEQPSVRYVYVEFIRADGVGRYGSATMRRWDATLTDQVTLIDLEPETEYDITVSVDGDVEARLSTAIKATTAVAPTGWRAPPRGAQNLSVTATHDTITVTWDAPVPNTRDRWIVYVSHPSWTKSYARWVSAPLAVTLGPFTPETTYSVKVAHLDHHGTDVTTTVTMADAPRHGHYDQPPLIEWWADGRPTSPPLHLELASSRELCTAGTLTEVSWTISGGVAPYTLSIEGVAVDLDADNIRINCGALTEAEAGDAEAALAAKTVSAVVTDSRGVQRQAALDVDRARALPAPTNVRRFSQVGEVIVSWDEVDGAGSQSPTIVHSGRSVTGLVRTRANHDGAPWRYHTATRLYADEWVLGPTSGVQVLSVAAVRHPLEVETPDALSWSDDLVYASTTVAQNVTLAATHDTVTVSWDRQPHVGYQQVWVWLSRADNEGGRRWKTLHEELGVAGRHTVIFNGLPADTQLEVVIEMHYAGAAERPDLPSNVTQHTVRTLLAPPGWTPAPVGPQSLRYMQTSGVTTVLWDEPYPDAEPSWFLTIENLATGAIWGTWVSGTAWTLPADLVVLPDTVYLVTVEHADLVSGAASISFRTPPTPPAGQAESLAPPARPMPLFEWWADGRPTSPPLHMKLRSSRELCTAGTLTEVSWTISGGVAPYELSIEGEAVDVDADNIRVNCGPLPTDPRTGELLAAQPKTFQASVSDSRGVSAAASVAVTLTTPPYLAADTALRYETYDSTGEAATSGSYAFLADGAAGAVATYEGLRDGTAAQLLIHKTDAQGTSRAMLYDTVAASDLFEWRQSYDCWVRYRVTEVRPDPPGDAQRKQLAVERMSYAFSGCTGAIAVDAAVLLAWGALPDLGGPTLAAPLRHGPFQIVPEDWAGQFEEDPFRPWPGNSYANPVATADLAEAQQLPHWRDPTLPAGWTLSWASSGDPHLDPPYGYCSWWATDRGYGGVELCGGFYPVQDRPRESSESSGAAVVETRMIAGRPAIVEYSPAGPNHNPYVAVRVLVSDPILDVVYHVRGLDGTLRGDRVNAGIAIARSLFEESN